MSTCGVHPLDQIVWAFDTHLHGPIEVEGFGVVGEGARDGLVEWKAKFQFANGVVLTFQNTNSSRWSSHAEYWRFIGTEGTLEVDYGKITKAEPQSLLTATFGQDDVRLVESHNHGGNFIDAVRTRNTPVAHIDDACRADVLCHLADIAIRVGRKIRWDPVKEEIIGDAEATRMTSRAWREPWGTAVQ
jgi:predicted dehydrogenase